MMEVKVGWWIALNAISFFPQKYSLFFTYFLTSFLLFIHRSCITHENIVLKVVNKCLENVKTTEQQLKLSVPPV